MPAVVQAAPVRDVARFDERHGGVAPEGLLHGLLESSGHGRILAKKKAVFAVVM
jgi:hypothetical protein